MRFYLYLVVFLISSLAAEAWACSCAGPPTLIKQAFDQAKTVFSARVGEIRKNEYGYDEEAILAIDKVWKGDPDKKFLAIFLRDQCTFTRFEVDKSYLVYAHRGWNKNIPDSYHVSMCSRTKFLDKGRIEARYLDAIVANKDTKFIDQSLLDILKSKEEENTVRIEAVELLGQMIEVDAEHVPEGTLDALINAAKSGDAESKLAIIDSLLNQNSRGREEVKEALLRLLKDDDQSVSNAAAEVIVILTNSDSTVFKALIQELEEARLKEWKDANLYESTLATLGVAIARATSTDMERAKTADLLYEMLDQVSHPSRKSSIIRSLGRQKEYAKKAIPKLLETLKVADDDYVKSAAIVALGEVKAMEGLEHIKPYTKDMDCAIAINAIEAIYKIDAKKFSGVFRNEAVKQMKKRFESSELFCKMHVVTALKTLGPAAKNMKPFLIEKYKAVSEDEWLGNELKGIIDALP